MAGGLESGFAGHWALRQDQGSSLQSNGLGKNLKRMKRCSGNTGAPNLSQASSGGRQGLQALVWVVHFRVEGPEVQGSAQGQPCGGTARSSDPHAPCLTAGLILV